MKLVTLIISLILAASPYSVLASGCYTASCDNYTQQGYGPDTNKIMSTSCLSKGILRLTTLNLNLCIGVSEGKMVAENNEMED